MEYLKNYFLWMLGALIFQAAGSASYNLIYVVLALYCTVMMFISYVKYALLPAEQQIQFIPSAKNG